MKVRNMSREELKAEILRLDALIQESSEAGLRLVKEMSKQPLSLEQMREQVRRQAQGPRPSDPKQAP